MRAGFIFILLVTLTLFANAQYTFVKQWDKHFGGTLDDYCTVLKTTDSGDLIIGGVSGSNITGDKVENCRGVSDYWIVKLGPMGNKLWDKTYGGSDYDHLLALQNTQDGGYILGGLSYSGISGERTETNRGDADYWVVKIDSNGNKQWDKRFGGTDYDPLSVVQQTKDGGYILGGYSESGLGGDRTEDNRDSGFPPSFDYWVVKIDSVGHKQWDKRFGGSSDDYLESLVQTNDRGYLLAGYSNSDSSGDKSQNSWGWEDYWIVKIDSIGHKEWDKKFGTLLEDKLYTVLQMNNGGYILFGGGGNKTGDKGLEKGGFWVIKTDATGNKVWENAYLGAPYPEGMVQTSDGGYLMSGDALSIVIPDTSFDKTELNQGSENTWVIKIDSSGLKQWDKTIFTTGADANGIAVQTSDGCYAVASSSSAGIGGYKTQAAWDSSVDYFIVKFCMDTFTGIDDRPQTTDNGGIQIQVWPNPFSSDLSIALKGENIQEATFTIASALGQLVYKREETNLATGYTKVLDLSPLPNGFYFVTVTQNGELFTKKVVKE